MAAPPSGLNRQEVQVTDNTPQFASEPRKEGAFFISWLGCRQEQAPPGCIQPLEMGNPSIVVSKNRKTNKNHPLRMSAPTYESLFIATLLILCCSDNRLFIIVLICYLEGVVTFTSAKSTSTFQSAFILDAVCSSRNFNTRFHRITNKLKTLIW